MELADLMNTNVLSVPPERILKTRVVLTVMGGRDTFRATEF